MEEGGRLCEGLEYGTEQAAEEEEEVRAAGLLAKPEAAASWLLKVITLTVSKVPTRLPQQLCTQMLSSCVTGWPGAWSLGESYWSGPW